MALSLASLQPGSKLWGVTAVHHSNDRGESFSAPCWRRALLCSTSSENGRSRVTVRAGVGGGGGAPGSFLTMEEAGLVEMASIDMHEKFLCRLTISSLNLLRVIAEQEGVAIEELNAGRVCDWFQKDKANLQHFLPPAFRSICVKLRNRLMSGTIVLYLFKAKQLERERASSAHIADRWQLHLLRHRKRLQNSGVDSCGYEWE